jgi:cell division topological specificity factor
VLPKFIKNMFSTSDESKEVAKSRLHFVLVQDRAGLNQEDLAKFRSEMIAVIEKYFVVNEGEFDISYQRGRETTTLLINSPVIFKKNSNLRTQKENPIKSQSLTNNSCDEVIIPSPPKKEAIA